MSHYFEALPDYIPFQHTGKEFIEGLDALHQPDKYLYADENGLKVVGKIQYFIQKFFGLIGFTNHTSIPNIEMGLAKFLYYGYSEGHTTHDAFRNILEKVRNRTQNLQFSVPMKNLMSLLDKNGSKELTEPVRSKLQSHLIDIYHKHSQRLSPMGGTTPIFPELKLSFGLTPFLLGWATVLHNQTDNDALSHENMLQVDLDKATFYARCAYALRIPALKPYCNELDQKIEDLKIYQEAEKLPSQRIPHAQRTLQDSMMQRATELQEIQPELAGRMHAFATRDLNYEARFREAEESYHKGNFAESIQEYERGIGYLKVLDRYTETLWGSSIPEWTHHYLDALKQVKSKKVEGFIADLKSRSEMLYNLALKRNVDYPSDQIAFGKQAIRGFELLKRYAPEQKDEFTFKIRRLESNLAQWD